MMGANINVRNFNEYYWSLSLRLLSPRLLSLSKHRSIKASKHQSIKVT